MRPKALDLFCGAGGAAMGLHRAGFEVTGVDIKPQPRYPFTFVQGDALNPPVRLEDFDLIWASPPCQAYSIATAPHGSRDRHPDLVADVRRMLRATGRRYVIENVRGAPLVSAFTLCGTMFGLRVFRHRCFEADFFVLVPGHTKHDGSTGAHRGYSTARSGRNGYICVAGHNFERDAAKSAMGIQHMGNRYELAQAIPPAYSEHIGHYAMMTLGRDGDPTNSSSYATPTNGTRTSEDDQGVR